MNFIKSIFQNKDDDEIHRVFRRFSKGIFKNRAVVEIYAGKTVKVKTSFEFTNGLVKFLANTIIGKTKVTGGIITTKDISKIVSFNIKNVKQFAGVKTFELDTELSKEDLFSVMNFFPDAVFCLSFSTDYGSLKVKVKAPKSAKPGKGGEDAKADYCVFITSDLGFKEEFAFDVKENFRKFRALHDFNIQSLVVPEKYKDDFEMARVYAKRKGKIVRRVNVDGVESITEKDFEA